MIDHDDLWSALLDAGVSNVKREQIGRMCEFLNAKGKPVVEELRPDHAPSDMSVPLAAWAVATMTGNDSYVTTIRYGCL